MVNKFAQVLGWLVIVFVILGVFNVGVFKFSYQWNAFGTLQFQTTSLSIPNEAKKIYAKMKD